MPYFRIDDQFHNSPLALAAGNAAIGLWVRCGSYSANYLLDGFVPLDVALAYGTRREVERAISAGLWQHVAPAGLLIPWADQWSADKVRAQRVTTAERQRRWKEAHHAPANAVTDDAPKPKPKPISRAAAAVSSPVSLNGAAAAAAVEEAIEMFIATKVDRDQPRKPDAYRRTLMQDIPGEYADALNTYMTEHHTASSRDIARDVFGMSIIDIRKAQT